MIGGLIEIQGYQTLFQSFLQDWITSFSQFRRQPECVNRTGNDQDQKKEKAFKSVYFFHNYHIVNHIKHKIK